MSTIDLSAYEIDIGETDYPAKHNAFLRGMERFLSLPGSGAWVTATDYNEFDLVSESSNYYWCLVAHTAGTFSTDLTAGKWQHLGALPGITDNATASVVTLGDAVVAFAVPVTIPGNVGIGGSIEAAVQLIVKGSGSETILAIRDATGNGTIYSGGADQSAVGGESGTDAMLYVRKDATTGRSINGAGTGNYGGSDYAEYEILAPGISGIIKGDIIGFNKDGLITDKYSEAVSFGIKSTDPAIVGGDAWGTEEIIGVRPEKEDFVEPEYTGRETSADWIKRDAAEEQLESDHLEALGHWKDKLEAERQKVDRISYAGKVPLNGVTGDPGDYIVPSEGANDSISAVAIAEADMTLQDSLRRVGQIKNIGEDGRPIVIVKMG